MPAITILYAGLLGLISIAIAVTTGRVRGQAGVSVGDGGNIELIAAMRRHANFVEVVPLALILIGLLEMNGVGSSAIHGLGGGLVVVRICHAIGYGTGDSLVTLRIIGAAGSTLITLVASVWAITVFF